MKTQVKLWKRYKQWVEDENQPLVDDYKKRLKKQLKEDGVEWAVYKKETARVEKLIDKSDAEWEEWSNLGWWKKRTTEHPQWTYLISRRRPHMPFPTLIMPSFNIKKVTQEGFMDWLADAMRRVK